MFISISVIVIAILLLLLLTLLHLILILIIMLMAEVAAWLQFKKAGLEQAVVIGWSNDHFNSLHLISSLETN